MYYSNLGQSRGIGTIGEKFPSEIYLKVSMKLSMETSRNLLETFRETSNLISKLKNVLDPALAAPIKDEFLKL